jgi:outer membrane protein OmpA-like peptidoglycan-associated protein
MGIRAAAPDDTPAHAGKPKRHLAATQSPHADFPIIFPSGSAVLGASAQQELAKIADALTDPSMKGVRFRIEGHTDTVGTDSENMTLSDARAHAVLDYLSDKFQVPRDDLEAVGVGKSQLVVETPDQTPDARNRVVRIIRLHNG